MSSLPRISTATTKSGCRLGQPWGPGEGVYGQSGNACCVHAAAAGLGLGLRVDAADLEAAAGGLHASCVLGRRQAVWRRRRRAGESTIDDAHLLL